MNESKNIHFIGQNITTSRPTLFDRYLSLALGRVLCVNSVVTVYTSNIVKRQNENVSIVVTYRIESECIYIMKDNYCMLKNF